MLVVCIVKRACFFLHTFHLPHYVLHFFFYCRLPPSYAFVITSQYICVCTVLLSLLSRRWSQCPFQEVNARTVELHNFCRLNCLPAVTKFSNCAHQSPFASCSDGCTGGPGDRFYYSLDHCRRRVCTRWFDTRVSIPSFATDVTTCHPSELHLLSTRPSRWSF